MLRDGGPVRIVHLITGLDVGGAEGMLARLVAGIDRERVASVVVSMTDAGAFGPVLGRDGIPVEVLGMRRGFPDPFGMARLIRVLRFWRPQILQTWLYHADILGLAAYALGRTPRLLWNLRCSESIGAGMVRLAASRLSRVPDRIIVNSRAGLEYHESLGYRPRRWEYIPNGFDTGALRPDPDARARLRAELGIPGDAVTIGLAARYHPMKDHAAFLAAAAILARERGDASFVLVGSGIDAGNRELAAAIAAHRLTGRVHLLGEQARMAAVYPAFDIAGLSSAFGEGFPNVLAEAMACGVPCVATDSGDSREIIGDTGIVVPPRDPAALAAAWRRLAGLAAGEREALGEAARARIARAYDIGAVIRRYERLYREVAASAPAGARP